MWAKFWGVVAIVAFAVVLAGVWADSAYGYRASAKESPTAAVMAPDSQELVKVFTPTGASAEMAAKSLEGAINDWINEKNPRIIRITQSSQQFTTYVIVWYSLR